MIQEVFIYLDDSGVLHKNEPNRFFAYAGYVFLSQKEKDRALAKYRAAVKNSRKKQQGAQGFQCLKRPKTLSALHHEAIRIF